MFTNVVWATDGSEHADRALDYARQLARGDGASLHVIHVIEQYAGSHVAGQPVRLNEKQIDDKINRQAAELRDKHGLRATVQMSPAMGGVARQIAKMSRDASADLIVVGTRGHSPVAGAILGSVTQHLLHLAHCPVLAVPPLEHSPETADEADELTATS